MDAFLNDEENFDGETELRIYMRSLFLDSSSDQFQWLSLIFQDQDVLGMGRQLSLLYALLDGWRNCQILLTYIYISFHFRKHCMAFCASSK